MKSCLFAWIAVAAATAASAQQFGLDPLQTLPTGTRARDMAPVDVNGDGHLDLVLANSGANGLLIGNGHGQFTDASALLPTNSDSTLAVVAGDIDGDGDVDLVFGNVFQQNRLYLNAGGRFVDATSRLPTRSRGTQALAMFDADGDADLDLLVGDQNAVVTLLRNNGNGTFTDVTASQMPSTTGNTHALLPIDADGDGDLDLVVGTDRTGNSLLRNDGRGRFTRAPSSALPSFGDATFDAASADINGDGRPDVVLANGLGANRLYFGQSNGIFVDATNRLPASNNNASFGVALGDVDDDGDVDIALATSFGQDELWLNDGTGRFTDATNRLPRLANSTVAITLSDVDQDGDADLILGRTGGTALLANHWRHLSATGSLRVAATWNLEFARARDVTTTAGSGVPALAIGGRRPALSIPGLGSLLIDPQSVVVLPALRLTATGRGTLPISIPNDPSLAGRRISTQGVVLDPVRPLEARLTNAISAVVLP